MPEQNLASERPLEPARVPALPERGTRALWMLAMAVLGEMCLAADFYGFAAVIRIVSVDLSLSPAEAGVVQGAFGLSFALGMLFWAPRSRHLSAARLYLIGLGGSGVLMLIQSHAQGYVELVMLRLVVGFFDSAVWIGSMKIVMQWFPRRQQGFVLGIILGAYSLAITLDFALGLPYAMAHGWRAFFMVLGCLTLAVGLLTQMILRPGPYRNPHDSVPRNPDVLRAIFSQPWIWIGAVAIFGALFCVAATTTWLIPAFIDTQGLPASMAPTIGTLMGLSQVAFLIVGGYFSDRCHRLTVIRIGFFLTIASALLCLLAASLAAPLPLLIAVAFLCGSGVFHGGAIFGYVGDRYGIDLGPSAAGYAEMVGVFATFVAPALLGLLLSLTGSYAWAFGGFLAVEILALLAYAVIARQLPKHAEAGHD